MELVSRKPAHTDQYYTSHHQTSSKESAASSLFNRSYSIIINKNDLTKVNVRIKQVLKENGFHESVISKIPEIFTKNHNFSQSQQQMQAMDIQEEGIIMK